MIYKIQFVVILLLLIISCSDRSSGKFSEITYKEVKYEDGIIRKGLFCKDLPIGVHEFYKTDSLYKYIQYINWDEEYVNYLKKYSIEMDVFEIDTSDLFGYPNYEVVLKSNNQIDTTKSNYISFLIISDTCIQINSMISSFNNKDSDKWMHLFIFREDDVHYVSRNSLDFNLTLSKDEVTGIRSKEFTLYCMAAEVSDEINYVHGMPVLYADLIGSVSDVLLH